MNGLYQFMAIGMGVILFGLLLAGILVIFRNLKRRMLPGQDKQAHTVLTESYWEEKRDHVRIGIVWPVSFETSNGSIQGKTKDISLNGAFIVCPSPLPLKEIFSLNLSLPGQESLSLKSEVIWSNANVPEERIITRGMGIRFLNLPEQDRKMLTESIASYIKENEKD
jgi:c-di-GMP-binding flagellar brake protein YcgR